MKIKMVVAFFVATLMTACSTFPIPATVKDDSVRFENFKRTKTKNREHVYLMCFLQRPTEWAEPKQYPAGEHNLWVRAVVSRTGVPNSEREAYANFKVNLPAGNSYMLNREIGDDNKIKLWIQQVDTGVHVSNVVETTLEVPMNYAERINKRRCDTSSV